MEVVTIMRNDELSKAKEIADALRKSGEWIPELCKELCDLAGLSEEWEISDGESFESTVFEAAEKLGVEIF